MERMTLTGALAALTLLLAGCSSSAEIASESTTATTQASKPTRTADGGSYGVLTDLRDEAVAAGLPCPSWDQHNTYKLASSSGACSDEVSMAIYMSEFDRDAQLSVYKEFGSMVAFSYLVGKNWTVSTPDPESLQKKLGGTVLRTSGK